MSNIWNPSIGSGVQSTRKGSAGSFWGPTTTVAVVNFEDAAVVESFRQTSAPVLTSAPTKLPPGINLIRRRTLIIYNNGGAPIYLGGTSGVTILDGYPVAPGTEKAFEIGASLDVYAIASGVTSETRILELA